MNKLLLASALSAALIFGGSARAQGASTDASALSMLPVAVSVAAPVVQLSA